jgi:hypothetical protein
MTSMASLADDVWNASTRTLTSLTLSTQAPWAITMSDSGTVTAGQNYLATVSVNYNGTLTDSANLPVVTIYDANRNVVVANVPMTRTGTGVYTYSYTTASNAAGGVWETVVTANVASGQNQFANKYWNVSTAPPQVIIRSMQSTVTPNVAANVRITNEGQVDYEYQYEWCVVSDINNACGGGDDTYFASAAKLIHPGDNFDTTLPATVPLTGTYYFKVSVFYGSASSKSTQQFTATAPTGGNGDNGQNTNNPPAGGGGGGGGGGIIGTPSISVPTVPIPNTSSSSTAAEIAIERSDINDDGKVNSVDFSIMLAYWKTPVIPKNVNVDLNHDGKVNSVDFSILLSQWGKHTPLK